MKLLISYNVFDAEEFLECSINQVKGFDIICICQSISNRGNFYDGGLKEAERLKKKGLVKHIIYYNPNISHPYFEELNKRNLGLQYARKNGYTHILNLDCDELFEDFTYWINYYTPMFFHYDWTVVKILTYFKTINLAIEDETFLPFVAKTTLALGTYPCDYQCDPTRKFSSDKYVLLPEITMHHYSWVRKDINRKVQNSTARDNIVNSSLLSDYESAENGKFIPHYKKRLKFVKNRFACLQNLFL